MMEEKVSALVFRISVCIFAAKKYSVCYCFESKNASFLNTLKSNGSNVCAKRGRYSLLRAGSLA
ncbi:hypothetical protein [Alistipes sp. CHKCI003]|uniref:hypothetical protein n=1 Tax=Alistipes sp. CHKCI003 TaxID=1780376 RepID=UPI001146AD4B|nr:hypothetical protein [Alistipes sp. CHKCI003]